MAGFVAQTLEAGGIEPVIAYYQPYSLSPELSVPSYCLAFRVVKSRIEERDGHEHHAIGAWLPELEFTHYLPNGLWKELVTECDFHVSASGNCLPATPFALLGVSYWAWVASPWDEDRAQRAARYSLPRRMLDRCVNAQGARRMQRKVLDHGAVVALSEYTRDRLGHLTSTPRKMDVLPVPIDTGLFKPSDAPKSGHKRIGFVGRLTDPRKNVALLLDILVWCRKHGRHDLELVLIGDDGSSLEEAIRIRGLQDAVVVRDDIADPDLPARLSSLDLFVVPSHQEGLCIAALEAMSCGVPVVSTPCGGPEEFVLSDRTGFVAAPCPEAMGRRVMDLMNNPELIARLGANARRLVQSNYSIDLTREKFWRSFSRAFRKVPIPSLHTAASES